MTIIIATALILLRTVDVEQLVPEDDPVRVIAELTGRLDLMNFYAAIETQEGEASREAIDPRLLISLWMYAYSQGVSSAREVSPLTEYHSGFQWLSGMRVVNDQHLKRLKSNNSPTVPSIHVTGPLKTPYTADNVITVATNRFFHSF